LPATRPSRRLGVATLLGALVMAAPERTDAQANAQEGAPLAQPAADPNTLVLNPVVVTGKAHDGETSTIGTLPPDYAGGQVARGGRVGVLGNRDFMDTPFNITTYTEKKIEDQQATTVADAVSTDPAVRVTSSPNGILDTYYIRGFPIAEGNLGEIALDGVYGVAPNYRLFTDYVERIDVIAGPTAMIYGMAPNSSVGGSINVVPKRAPETDVSRVIADYAGTSQIGAHVDLARRYGDNREFGVRFNAGAYRGNTQVERQSREALVGALSLDYQGQKFRATLDFISQIEAFVAPSRPFLVAAGVPVPAAPSGRSNVTQTWEWSQVGDQSLLLRAEYDIADNVTLFADLGGGRTRVDRLFGTPTIVNAAGNTTNTPGHFKFDIDRLTYDAGVRASFETGPVRHALSFQATRYQDWLARGSVNAAQAVLSNLYNPVLQPTQNVPAPAQVSRISATTLNGVSLADTLSAFDERAQLTLGLRWQQIGSDNFNSTTGAVTSSFNQSVVTPMAALIVKPWKNVSIYTNYVEGLSKGDVAPSTATNAGEALAPYVARQVEVGAKVDFGQLAATLSFFQITKPFAQLVNNVYTASGEQRNRGVELKVFGEVVPSVRLMAGMTLLDARLTATNNVATNGNVAIGGPVFQGSLGAEWDTPFVKGLTFDGTVVATSSQYVDAANTQSIPAWARLDLGLRYRTTVGKNPVTFRGAVQNVFDTNYWMGVTSFGAISQGMPRTVLLSAAVDF
jgi:iron complex outermembrane recepter protein